MGIRMNYLLDIIGIPCSNSIYYSIVFMQSYQLAIPCPL